MSRQIVGKSGLLDRAEEQKEISGVQLLGEMGGADAQTPKARNRKILKSRSSE
jgi:proteasome assembly chaperone (PAC2) family protein